MDIRLPHMRLPLSVGVFEWEKQAPQVVAISLSAGFEAGIAPTTDALEDTVDYTALEAKVAEVAQARHYNLLEALIAAIGSEVLAAFPRITELTVSVEKPGVMRYAESVTLTERFVR